MRRLLWLTVVVLGTFSFTSAVNVAQACPMCKAANETDENLPRAYMYSILFMLAMPATVLTAFGVGFYRISKQQQSHSDAPESPRYSDDESATTL